MVTTGVGNGVTCKARLVNTGHYIMVTTGVGNGVTCKTRLVYTRQYRK